MQYPEIKPLNIKWVTAKTVPLVYPMETISVMKAWKYYRSLLSSLC